MMFCLLLVHKDSFTLFILIVARPSIQFFILFYSTSFIISDYLRLSSLVPKLLIKEIFLRSHLRKIFPFSILLSIAQDSFLGTLLCNIFINDLSSKINLCIYLLFVDDLKFIRDTKSVEDREAVQAGIDSVH